MKLLTDTHTLVWALAMPGRLGSAALAALAENPFTASVINFWELVLKKDKPEAPVKNPLDWWEKYVVRTGIPMLAVRTAHVRALDTLPPIHKDPFDRLLVAQSLSEGLTLVSKDIMLAAYKVPVIW